MKILLTVTLLFSIFLSKTTAQNAFNPYSFKNKLRVGVYVSPKVCLHTKIITDIAHLYVQQDREFRESDLRRLKDTTKQNNINKSLYDHQRKRYDTADAFERLFTTALQFTSFSLNKSYSPNQDVNYNDTFFLPKIKIEQVKDSKVLDIIVRDTLDYLIRIQNLRSEESGTYFIVKYDLLIKPKLKSRSTEKKTLSLIFENIIKNPDSFLSGCSNPLECLIANSSETLCKVILGKIFSDGYYPELKKPNGF